MQTLFRVFVAAVAVAAAVPASAQTANGTLSASVNGLARLSLSSAGITFPDADPDTVPTIPASQGPIAVTAKARTSVNGAVTLTVLAADQLRSGLDTIPAANVTWTATGPGFTPGTVSATTPQTVGAWSGSGVRSGTQAFLFRNLWTYATGIYTLTLTFTLTAA